MHRGSLGKNPARLQEFGDIALGGMKAQSRINRVIEDNAGRLVEEVCIKGGSSFLADAFRRAGVEPGSMSSMESFDSYTPYKARCGDIKRLSVKAAWLIIRDYVQGAESVSFTCVDESGKILWDSPVELNLKS